MQTRIRHMILYRRMKREVQQIAKRLKPVIRCRKRGGITSGLYIQQKHTFVAYDQGRCTRFSPMMKMRFLLYLLISNFHHLLHVVQRTDVPAPSMKRVSACFTRLS